MAILASVTILDSPRDWAPTTALSDSPLPPVGPHFVGDIQMVAIRPGSGLPQQRFPFLPLPPVGPHSVGDIQMVEIRPESGLPQQQHFQILPCHRWEPTLWAISRWLRFSRRPGSHNSAFRFSLGSGGSPLCGRYPDGCDSPGDRAPTTALSDSPLSPVGPHSVGDNQMGAIRPETGLPQRHFPIIPCLRWDPTLWAISR